MEIVYWVLASLMGAFYLYSGGLKAFRSKKNLIPMMAWVEGKPILLVRYIGWIEILGAIGLIVPIATGVGEWLSLAAALGFAFLQIFAGALHAYRGEYKNIIMNIVLLVLALVLPVLAILYVI